MARSTVHYADSDTNSILKKLHNKLRPAGTPVQRVEYIIELLLLRIFEVKIKHEKEFEPLRKLFEGENYRLLFSHLISLNGEQIKSHLNKNIFPFYGSILSKIRKLFSGNISQKVQDVLVLIEEVFSNSSFTTNVQSGNIQEIIGLVAEIDESRILKTDLFGDAIESALSETGGTQDIGLYRTPNHIRQMMVAMVEPNFNDTIFDPACGTGGFLFDSYQYAIEKITKDGKWPSEDFPPNHPELNKYFKKLFKKSDLKMPDKDVANYFYRAGIGGIEYMGTIRKMAAINLYIRGLNPQNIQQGDALKIYDPYLDGGSKTLVIANPPFGAERDQPAYPNVWEEYSKESETTILFVKLMFDLLRQGGRCAVVVSEGFITWNQNSARNLRKKLLEEANLRTIISLPQGVFVSKNGQGAKTSVLYFEKGGPTDWVWHYKIENDGFTMGTNRKPIEGCQIPEVVEFFTKYVKRGKVPPESKNSFVIPSEWIKTLDPRIKERIESELKDYYQVKNKTKRKELVSELDKKCAKKKINREEYKEKLWQFDNVLENKISNELTKQIEGAHSYSFNLSNYRSDLSEDQIEEWEEVLKKVKLKNGSSIENKYSELKTASPKLAIQILASFNPKNALQIDIAREFLSKLNKKVLGKEKKLKKLEEILGKGFQYPIVSLKELVIINNERIKPLEFPAKEFTILGVSNQNGVFINEKLKGSDIKQSYFKVYKNQFCYNPYRINVGSIGFCEFDIENQIISGAYNVFGCNENKLNPKYLDALFKTRKFLDYVNEKASGGVRMNFKIEYMQEWKISLPPLEVQNEIVEKIEKQKQIIEGAEKIGKNINFDVGNFDEIPLSDIFDFEYGITKSASDNGKFRLIRITDINNFGQLNNDAVYTEISEPEKRYILQKGDLVMARTGATFGKVLYFDSDTPSVFASYLIRFIPKTKDIDKKYVYYFCLSQRYWQQANQLVDGGTQPQFSSNKISKIKIPFPPLKTQRQIVEKIDQQMQALGGVQLLKSDAQKQIQEILNKVWGDELK